jgi:prepilin-type N-terminal cleavage/methylation domain-containing protein
MDTTDRDVARAEGQRGFTLIELMIVVAIIAVLASILIPNFLNARAQAQTAACMANLNQIATAAELYYADQDTYPATGAVAAGGSFVATGVDYLGNTPHDQAATPGDTYTFTNNGTNLGYTIACPASAVHPYSTLAKLQNTTAATTQMKYVSGVGLEGK